MAWEDNFNKIAEVELPIEGNKVWKFALEEHKTKGTMQMNVRLWQKAKTEGGYEGPTKNGFIQGIKSVEDVDQLEKTFAAFFAKVKDMI